MDREPTQSQDKNPARVKPAFDRAAEPELARQADIDLKAERIRSIASFGLDRHVDFARERHGGTTYTKDDIERLSKPEFTPPGFTQPVRVPGTPKTMADINKLARADAQAHVAKREAIILKIAERMKEQGSALGHGKITQTRRGPAVSVAKLDKPVNLNVAGHAFRRATGSRD
ncbi:MAG: hypothetical protein AAFQ58_08240 [Pseudomonadota bacterium]